jgi:hypothetical protein
VNTEVAAEQDDDDDDTVLLLLVRACSGRFFMSLNLWMVDQAMEVGWFTEQNKHVSSDGMVEVREEWVVEEAETSSWFFLKTYESCLTRSETLSLVVVLILIPATGTDRSST